MILGYLQQFQIMLRGAYTVGQYCILQMQHAHSYIQKSAIQDNQYRVLPTNKLPLHISRAQLNTRNSELCNAGIQQVRHNCPIIVHGKSPHLSCLLTLEETLLTSMGDSASLTVPALHIPDKSIIYSYSYHIIPFSFHFISLSSLFFSLLLPSVSPC